jgi:hypothetical protein
MNELMEARDPRALKIKGRAKERFLDFDFAKESQVIKYNHTTIPQINMIAICHCHVSGVIDLVLCSH